MRLVRLLGVLSVLTLIAIGTAHAGSVGAVVTRGTQDWLSWWWNDYTVTNIVILSSNPDFYIDGVCNNNWPPGPAPDWKLIRYHDVYQMATGKDNAWFKGPQFAQVYRLPEPVETSVFTLNWPDDICSVLKGEVLSDGRGPYPLVAKGITEFSNSGENNCALGPGQNTWDMKAVGTLATQPGVCGGGVGMAKFDFNFRYMLTNDAYIDPTTCLVDDPTHIRLVVIRGPSLKCIGK